MDTQYMVYLEKVGGQAPLLLWACIISSKLVENEFIQN